MISTYIIEIISANFTMAYKCIKIITDKLWNMKADVSTYFT